MSYAKNFNGSGSFLNVLPPVAVKWKNTAVAAGGKMTKESPIWATNFLVAITGSSYYSKIVYLLPMLGGNLQAGITPLIDTLNIGVPTNTNFVDADFNEQTGLKGNGTNKILDSKIRGDQLGVSNNAGIGYWENEIDFGGSAVEPMGMYKEGASPDNRFVLDIRATVRAFRWGAASTYAYDNIAPGNSNFYGQRSGSTSRTIYVDGVSKATNTTDDSANGAADNTIRMLGCKEGPYGTVYWKGRFAVAYMTDGTLTSTEILDLHNAINTHLISAPGKHSELIKWKSRISGSSGTLTANSENIARNFLSVAKTKTYYSKIVYLLPMLGGNLSASLVPLIDTLNVGIATNYNFVNGDFSETGGLQSNGSTKKLDLIIKASQLTAIAGGAGLGYWETNWGSYSVAPVALGSYINTGNSKLMLEVYNGAYTFYGPDTVAGNSANRYATAFHSGGFGGFRYGQQSGSVIGTYFNGAVITTTANTVTPTNSTELSIGLMGTFSGGGGSIYHKGRCAVACLTNGTLSDSEVSDFYSDVSTYLITGSGKVVSASYFGPIAAPNYSDGFQQWGTWAIYSNPSDTSYVCPGTGTKRVYSLSFWAKSNGGTPGTARLAIYDSSFNLIGQGESTFTVSSTTEQWIGHVGYSSLKPIGGAAGDPIYLTGGTQYVFAFSTSNTDLRIGYKSVGTSVSSSWYITTNWTSGFPNSFAAGTQFTERLPVRVEVVG
jgi:hypothetical protein